MFADPSQSSFPDLVLLDKDPEWIRFFEDALSPSWPLAKIVVSSSCLGLVSAQGFLSVLPVLHDVNFMGTVYVAGPLQQALPSLPFAVRCLRLPFRVDAFLDHLDTTFVNGLSQEVIRLAGYTLSSSEVFLTHPQRPSLLLTERERDLLFYLARHAGQTVSREDLLLHVWGYQPTTTSRTVSTHMHRLRQKLAQDASLLSLLCTDAGGYRLNLQSQ